MPDIFVPKEKQKESAPIRSGSTPIQSGSESTTRIQVGQPLGIFTSFCKNPAGVTFHSQERNEAILLFTRKHFITNILWIITTFFLIILPFLIQLVLTATSTQLPQLPSNYVFITRIFYYATVFSYAFAQFITWYYNISLVTSQRIVDIDYSHLLFHDVAITKVDLVEDVHYRKTGFFASLFNFGDVFVQTAGETKNFDFLRIPNPQGATELIIGMIGEKKHG